MTPPDEAGIDPLYLFACSLQWLKQGNTSAGWELVGALKPIGTAARVAAALLVETENMHFRVEDLLRAQNMPGTVAFERGPATHEVGEVMVR